MATGVEHQHSGSSISSEATTTTKSAVNRLKGKPKKVIIIASDDDADDCSSQTASGHSDSASYIPEDQIQPAMESLRNYSSADLKLVVRYHGRGRHHGDADHKKAVGVGARQRQRAASRRASAAATRVAEARRLLRCVGGQHYMSV